MRFNLLDLLFPRETKFYALFHDHASRLIAASKKLRELLALIESPEGASRDSIRAAVVSVNEIERAADKVEARLNETLEESFITPFDRDDIHLMGSVVDNCVDAMKALTHKIDNYVITKLPPHCTEFADLIVEGSMCIGEAFKGMEKKSSITTTVKSIGELERKGDFLFSICIGDLFKGGQDPIEVIKAKEIYEGLEDILNKIDGAGKVLRRVMIKQG
jgi:uncharacterized protein Yka (UPF0111/DUF47 family)